ncbi:MAG: VWA domain-containing protein [Myxococcaceae bacterium]|nr:MAG: VWA domain-containing protein [Myxococcaceae bacterium]
MLPKDLIRRIRKLEIRTRKVVSDMLAGQIKVFTEERELTVMLLVDVSASNEFGSKDRTKAEVAAEVAAQIAFSAIANNDRVGLILFSDRVEKVVPPRKGRTHVLRLVSDILTFKPKGRGTDLAAGLTYLTQVAKRKAVTFLVSDFLATNYEKPLRLVGRKHDLVPVVIEDPLEQVFPRHGLVEMEDPETGERFVVDTSSPSVRGRFSRAMQAQRDERRKLFRKLELDHVELRAGDDHGKALAQFFRARARRMAS